MKHSKTFDNIKQKLKQIIENKHFDTTNMTTKMTIYGQFSSGFLNNYESRYSTNELELLAVVWALEHFKHYLHGQELKLLTDHQALLSALIGVRGNKTYQSRLTRWVDMRLPFNFTIENVPGKDMGFADYLSRNQSQNLSRHPQATTRNS